MESNKSVRIFGFVVITLILVFMYVSARLTGSPLTQALGLMMSPMAVAIEWAALRELILNNEESDLEDHNS